MEYQLQSVQCENPKMQVEAEDRKPEDFKEAMM